MALALLLLVGAGLMTRSFAQLMRVSPGFEPSNLLAVQIYLPQAKYRTAVDRTRFYMDAIRRVGVASRRASRSAGRQRAADVSRRHRLRAAVHDRGQGRADQRRGAARRHPHGHARLLRDDEDRARQRAVRSTSAIAPGAPGAMVINETMARRYFGGENPIGQVVRNPHGAAEVVGIVGDVKHYGLDSEPRAELFMPAWQQPLNGMALVVRTASDPKAFVDTIRREVLAIDAEQPIYDASAMVDVVARSVFLPRISMLLLGAFAVIGAAARGRRHLRRGVVHRDAADARARRPDGARRRRRRTRCGWCWAGACCWSPAGTACGLLASVAVTRAIGGLLYDVSPLDPIVFVGVSLLLAAAGFVASVDPRAARDTRRSDRRAAQFVDDDGASGPARTTSTAVLAAQAATMYIPPCGAGRLVRSRSCCRP